MTVRVENIVKRFGSSSEAAAVANVSFEAQPKAITTLLGPSGSGKSTLLRLIAGLETPDAGRVFIDGQDAHRLAHRLARGKHIDAIFGQGLHEFLTRFITDNNRLGEAIAEQYLF